MSFNCTTFCPEVLAIYHCVITSQRLLLSVSGNLSGFTSYDQDDSIGTLKQIGSSFTANKTGSNSFSLNFTANVEFNNSVTVTCQDLGNGNTRQCTIELEGKRWK